MAVARDATGTILNQTDNTAGAHSLTNYTGLTVVSNTNGAILYIAHITDPGVTTPALASVTGYTLIGAISAAVQDANWVRTEIWGKVGDTTGAQSIPVATNAAWTINTQIEGWAVSWTGVNQSGGASSFANLLTKQGNTSNPSSTPITKNASADATVSALSAGNDSIATPNKTQLYLNNANSPSSAAQFETGGASTQTHTWTYTVAGQWAMVAFDLVAAGGGAAPFRQRDWPLPGNPEPYPFRGFEWGENRRMLIGQDKFPSRQRDWPLPGIPEPYPYRSFEWDNRKILVGQDALPFRQRDWPLPSSGFSDPDFRRSWTWSYNLNLIGKDQLPFRQRDWPLPTAPEPDWRRGWTINLLQTTLTPIVVMPFRQTDWRLPVGAEPDWRRSWTWSYNQNLIGQDALPFRQTDWQLPQAPPLLKTDQLPNFLPLTATAVIVMPFRQTDWPVPIAAEPDPRRSWASSYNLNLIGQDVLPFRQKDWPLPTSPEPDARRGWASSYNLNLIGQDQLPFRQKDWPLPVADPAWRMGPVLPNLTLILPPFIPPVFTGLPGSNPFSAMHNFGRLGST